MQRTEEFHRLVDRALRTSRQPEEAPTRLPVSRDQFSEAARGITEGITRTKSITESFRVGAASDDDVRQHEQMVMIFATRCAKELATLESRLSGSAVGDCTQQVLAHRKSVVAMLYEVLIKKGDPAAGEPQIASVGPLLDPARLPPMSPGLLSLAKSSLRTGSTDAAGPDGIAESRSAGGAAGVPRPVATVASDDLPEPGTASVDSSHAGAALRKRMTATSSGPTGVSAALRAPVVDRRDSLGGATAGHHASMQQQGGMAMALLEPARHAAATESLQIERQMHEVSSMISLISEHLSSQQEEIQHVLEAAEESATLVNQGNSELAQANERPDHFSIYAVTLLLAGAAVLLFYDWGSRR